MTMAEMICDIQQGASTDVWAGSPDSVEATPLMPQITLSPRDAGGHRRSRHTIAHFHFLDTL